MKNVDVKLLSKVFTSTQLSAVASGDYGLIKRVCSDHLVDDCDTLESFFTSAYHCLGRDYRAEYFFKNTLMLRRLLGRHSLRTATMLTEFRVGKSKADCVIINGKSTCYEIKSEFDSLYRLDAQLSDYSELFDEVYVVCARKHLESVLKICPDAVGVLTLNERNYFSTIKKPRQSSEPINREMLFKSLRKVEYTELARLVSGSAPVVPNGELFAKCYEIIVGAPEDLLRKSYLKVLKTFRPLDEEFVNSLPDCLKNIAVSYKFSATEVRSLKKLFNNKENLCTVPFFEVSSLS